MNEAGGEPDPGICWGQRVSLTTEWGGHEGAVRVQASGAGCGQVTLEFGPFSLRRQASQGDLEPRAGTASRTMYWGPEFQARFHL